MHVNDLLATITHGVNLAALGTTTLLTTPDGSERFFPLFVAIEATASSGILTVCACSVGSNSPTFDNILPITTLTGVIGVNTRLLLPLTGTGLSTVAPSTAVVLKVTTAATGGTQSVKVALLGFFD